MRMFVCSDSAVSDIILATDGIVRSTVSDEHCCAICTVKINPVNWQKHIEDPIHVTAVQQFNLLFKKLGTGVSCKICNMVVDWSTSKTHVVSHGIMLSSKPPNLYRTFAENHVLEFETQFYCFSCDAVFSDWYIALCHVTTIKHQSLIKARLPDNKPVTLNECSVPYEVLVANGIVVYSAKSMKCKICGCVEIGQKDMRQHVEGLVHKARKFEFVADLQKQAKKKVTSPQLAKHQELKEPRTKEANPNSLIQNLTKINNMIETLNLSCISSKKVNNIEEEEDNTDNANLPCLSIISMDGNKYRCRICDTEIYDKKNLKNHVKGKQHREAQKKYGCDNIAVKEGNVYYCGCCYSTLSNRKLAFDHMTDENHMNNANLPCMSIIWEGPNKYQCTICDVAVVAKKNLDDHVKGKRHVAAQKKFGCQNITLQRGNLYYCGCCDSTFSSRKDACTHMKNETHIKNANLPCICTMMLNNKYHCRICNVDSDIETNFMQHLNGKRHAAAQEECGCCDIALKEDNLYHCGCCNSTLPSRKRAFDHIKEAKHVRNTNLPCISIMLVGINNYNCRICDVDSTSETDLEIHVKGRRHATAQKKYGCDYILRKEGNLYHCGCCDSTFSSRKDACLHINEEKHVKNANLPCFSIVLLDSNNYQCRICDVESNSETDLESHVKGRRHATAQKKYGCDYILRKEGNLYHCGCCDSTFSSRKDACEHINEEKHVKNANLPCFSIVVLDSNNYQCRICDVESNSETDLESHVKGRRHATAQKKYGCDYISRKEGNLYHCGCCDSTFSSRKDASEHINEEKHVKVANLPCISISLVDLNKYHCEICDVDADNKYNLEQHIQGKRHASAQKKYGCDHISRKQSNLYCSCCNLALPSRKLAFDHMKGEKHTSALKLSDNQNQQPTSKEKPKNAESTKLPESSSKSISQNSPCSYIFKEDDMTSYCALCDCSISGNTNVKVHIGGNQHITALKDFSDNNISIQELNFYYCGYCSCKISGYVNVQGHLRGIRHANSISKMESASKKQPEQKTSKKTAIELQTKRPNEKTSVPNVTCKGTNVKNLRLRKTSSNKIFISDKEQTRCSICNASVAGAVNMHIHLARHLSNDFITSDNNGKKADKINDCLESRQIERDIVTKTEATGRLEDTNLAICKEKAFGKRVEKEIDVKTIVKHLDFADNNIYSMEDKSADIELGIKLGFVMDEKSVYCLVCQKIVDGTGENFYEHLRSLDHCEYLDKMEKDNELFDSFPGQFSQFDLALEYMEEISNDLVRCLACDQGIDNIDIELQEHINDKNHMKRCAKHNTKAKVYFENGKSMECDWYEVQTYWCVPCIKKYRSEVHFAKHLESEDHAYRLKEKQNTKRKMMFDFCAACALLWYGYRCTWAYHCDIPAHLWLTRDGHHTSTKIPETVERLLAKPEDYINETKKYFDEISVKEREKVETLVRDLEKAVKTKFSNAKVYPFGSRVSGLGSLDSDIDVFLDCGNMYDGESSSMERILNFMTVVRECLNKEEDSWNVQELLTTCRSPIIKAYHRVTGLSCDMSFENGLAVENTRLIKFFNDVFPSCRTMILFLKQWLKLCKLSGSERITNYALYWLVIFYLQKEAVLPSIAKLIAMKNRSHVIAGWEVGVSRDGIFNERVCNFSIKELLIRFFTYYANFDYQHDVACPLLGEVVPKRAFADSSSLPKEMEPYKAHVSNSGSPFRFDSGMCIQDPFDLQHNLSKAVSKVYINRFRKYCSNSLDVLSSF